MEPIERFMTLRIASQKHGMKSAINIKTSMKQLQPPHRYRSNRPLSRCTETACYSVSNVNQATTFDKRLATRRGFLPAGLWELGHGTALGGEQKMLIVPKIVTILYLECSCVPKSATTPQPYWLFGRLLSVPKIAISYLWNRKFAREFEADLVRARYLEQVSSFQR